LRVAWPARRSTTSAAAGWLTTAALRWSVDGFFERLMPYLLGEQTILF
jgi:hypothetical protein